MRHSGSTYLRRREAYALLVPRDRHTHRVDLHHGASIVASPDEVIATNRGAIATIRTAIRAIRRAIPWLDIGLSASTSPRHVERTRSGCRVATSSNSFCFS
jgi:hypothetical protein